MAAPPPATYIAPAANGDTSDPAPPQQQGKMLYTYAANGDGEISVSEGASFALLDPDDGSGWIKIKPASFGSVPGLVPASYAELLPASSALRGGGPSPDRPISTASTSASGSDTPAAAAAAAPKVKKQGPAVAPRRAGAKKVKHVEALYTYAASGEGEMDMQEGERLVLLQPDSGDGWCEVESLAGAGRGIVPASWVREV